MQADLPEPAASLGSGIVMGWDGTMPRDLRDAFRETGLAHFVAVSGSNIALVTALVFVLITPIVGRNWATLAAGSSLVVYVFLVGVRRRSRGRASWRSSCWRDTGWDARAAASPPSPRRPS